MLKLKRQSFGHLIRRTDSLEKTLMLGKIKGGWHHRLHGHEFEQTLGVGDGHRGLAFGSLCGRKESDMTEQLN